MKSNIRRETMKKWNYKNIITQCRNLYKADRCLVRTRGRGRKDSSHCICHKRIYTCHPLSKLSSGRRQALCIPTPLPSLQSHLSSWHLQEALELWTPPDALPLPQHHKALMGWHESHLCIFWPFSNCIINSRLWHRVRGAFGKNTLVNLYLCTTIHQFYLLLEVILSRWSSPRRVWTVCPGDSVRQMSEKKTKGGGGEGKRLPVGDKWFWRICPRGKCGQPEHGNTSDVHKRHGRQLPLLQTSSNQAPNLKFQLMPAYFFF